MNRVSIPVNSFQRPQISLTAPTVVDLFSGAGGFGLGFQFAGFRLVACIEKDKWAADTLRANHSRVTILEKDIRAVEQQELISVCKSPDVLIGSPPCQGFSRANNSKNRPSDPRNDLFREFIRAASVLNPKVLLLENVPGILSPRGGSNASFFNQITNEYRRLGFTAYSAILRADEYGVPQARSRLFILGLRGNWSSPFPQPTHTSKPTSPTAQSTFVALPCVTTWEAISNLPSLAAREGTDSAYCGSLPCHNDYQELLKGSDCHIYNHKSMNHSARIVQRFSMLKFGESGGLVRSPQYCARKRGSPDELSGKVYEQNNRRMYPDRPCHTLPASFYANFVHPYQHRNFTPREGARLQSFPDWYVFKGKPNVPSSSLLKREGRTSEQFLSQYNQIGNAVPPLLSYALASHIRKHVTIPAL